MRSARNEFSLDLDEDIEFDSDNFSRITGGSKDSNLGDPDLDCRDIEPEQVDDVDCEVESGYEDVGFVLKDLYNKMDLEMKREIAMGDVEGAIWYLVEVYRTNEDKKPLVVLAGVNNHCFSIIYGCALLQNESYETYQWMLETFRNAMDKKKPMSVLIDGDKSMRKAIKTVFPKAKYRLCSWHIMQNAKTNVKRDEFLNRFGILLWKKCSTDEFDFLWARMIIEFWLEGKDWVAQVFEERHLWVEAYVRGQFFVGMSFDFVIAWLRYNEAKAIHQTEDTTTVLTTPMVLLERHASEVYTRNVFYRVRKHLNRQGLLKPVHMTQNANGTIYVFSKHKVPNNTWIVELSRKYEVLQGSCLKFESKGFRCVHMFRVMILEEMTQIPRSCILHRWIRQFDKTRKVHGSLSKVMVGKELSSMAKFASLTAICKQMCYPGSQIDRGYDHVMEVVVKVICTMRDKWKEAIMVFLKSPSLTVLKGDMGTDLVLWIQCTLEEREITRLPRRAN
ncbi:hypothetical protein ACH5RR_003004 [Cinchona calisaya]|uniref:MULE transposase domain-containing protein n=1 Tax=Cinchona calisaya TaxID=153742 RepID=A0ABD3ATY2_9GENT